MKIKFFISIFIFLLSTPTYCEITNARNLIKEGLFYNKITKKLFTGLVEFQYGNGQLRAKGRLKKGKEEGYEDYNKDERFFQREIILMEVQAVILNFIMRMVFYKMKENTSWEKRGKWNTYWDKVI